MARIRSIKPEAFTSETLAAVPVAARWTFAGLWTYCDDQGRARGDARLVKAAIYPLDDEMTPEVIESHLASLEAAGLLCRYISAGRSHFHVINFAEHQKPNKPLPSKLPECSRSTHGGLPDPGGSPTPCSSSRRGVGVGGETTTSRDIVARTDPSPLPPDTTPTAQSLIAEWIDTLKPNRPPDRVIGQLSKELRDMLKEGIPPDDLRRGIVLWQAKGLHPSAIASAVHEARTPRPANGHKASTTDARVGDALALAAKYAVLESRESA